MGKREASALGPAQLDERSWMALFSSFPGLAYRCRNDAAWTMELASSGCLELTGYATEDLVENRRVAFGDLVHPDDAGPLWEKCQANLAAHRRCSNEYRIRTASGEEKWVWDQAEGVYAPTGELLAIVGFVTDITARKKAEERLQKAEALLRSVHEACPLGFLVVESATLEVSYHNARFLELWGLGGAELPTGVERLFCASPNVDGAEDVARDHLVLSRRGGPPTSDELSLRGERFLRRYGAGIPGAAGEERARLFIYEEVTEHRRLQRRLAHADRLTSLGTLAAGVAHEINNPLTYVVLNLELISRGLAGAGRALGELPSPTAGLELKTRLEDLREANAEALQGTERVRSIVRDLQTLARSDESRAAATQPLAVLESALSMAGSATKARARVVRQLAPVPAVPLSEARLGQVLLNLLMNAAQAIPPGAPQRNEIQVRTRADDARVFLEVSDTGVGIPPENLSRLFDPFFTTKPVGEGTGLGLAICHSIVSGAGGRIEVESAPGKGTTFRVVLPQATDAATAVTRTTAGPAVARRRVLVVDDEAPLAASLKRILSAEHDTSSVTEPREALALLERGQRFDAVLCDLDMPELTGMELFERTRRLDPDQAARFIFITGGASSPHVLDFLRSVPNRLIQKPFEVKALLEQLRELMREQANV